MKINVIKYPFEYGLDNKFLVWSTVLNNYVEPLTILSFNTGFIHVALVAFDEVIVFNWLGDLLGFRMKNRLDFPDIYKGNSEVINEVIKALKKYDSYNGLYKENSVKLGIGLGSNRLGDYFFQLNGLCEFMLKTKPERRAHVRYFVSKENCFWRPDKIFNEISSSIVWVKNIKEIYTKAAAEGFESVMFLNRFTHDSDSSLGNLSDSVRNLQYKNLLDLYRESTFCLLISLDLEKRIWVNQADVLRQAITYLRKNYNKVTVLLNGMTGTEFGHISDTLNDLINNEKIIAENICAGLDVRFINLSGMSLNDKCDFISGADMFIAPIGSSTMLPSLVLNKPGLVVGNRSMITEPFYRKCALKTTWAPSIDSIEDMTDVKGAISWHKDKETVSYYIKPNALIDGLKLMLDNLHSSP